MASSREELYDIHSQNLAAVDRGLNRLRLSANRAVAQGQRAVEADLTKVYALLLATKLEARLRKVLYEAAALDEPTRAKVLAQRSQDAQWLRLVDEAFKRKYGVGRLTKLTLPATAWLRREVLRDAIRTDLAPVIRLRNCLAHGQWAVTLNNAGTATSKELDRMLQDLNLVALKHRERLIDKIGETVSDLAISRRTFERDFDRHFRAVEDARARLAKDDYDEWVEAQRRSYTVASERRRASFQPSRG
jgi:hypothetical protein